MTGSGDSSGSEHRQQILQQTVKNKIIAGKRLKAEMYIKIAGSLVLCMNEHGADAGDIGEEKGSTDRIDEKGGVQAPLPFQGRSGSGSDRFLIHSFPEKFLRLRKRFFSTVA